MSQAKELEAKLDRVGAQSEQADANAFDAKWGATKIALDLVHGMEKFAGKVEAMLSHMQERHNHDHTMGMSMNMRMGR